MSALLVRISPVRHMSVFSRGEEGVRTAPDFALCYFLSPPIAQTIQWLHRARNGGLHDYCSVEKPTSTISIDRISIRSSRHSHVHRSAPSVVKSAAEPQEPLTAKRIAQIMVHPSNEHHLTKILAETRRHDSISTALPLWLFNIKELDQASIPDP